MELYGTAITGLTHNTTKGPTVGPFVVLCSTASTGRSSVLTSLSHLPRITLIFSSLVTNTSCSPRSRIRRRPPLRNHRACARCSVRSHVLPASQPSLPLPALRRPLFPSLLTTADAHPSFVLPSSPPLSLMLSPPSSLAQQPPQLVRVPLPWAQQSGLCVSVPVEWRGQGPRHPRQHPAAPCSPRRPTAAVVQDGWTESSYPALHATVKPGEPVARRRRRGSKGGSRAGSSGSSGRGSSGGSSGSSSSGCGSSRAQLSDHPLPCTPLYRRSSPPPRRRL